MKSFRPLTGTLLSKPVEEFETKEEAIQVSVPSRGLSYLNHLCMFYDTLIIVSVPSRGLSYLNQKWKNRKKC